MYGCHVQFVIFTPELPRIGVANPRNDERNNGDASPRHREERNSGRVKLGERTERAHRGISPDCESP